MGPLIGVAVVAFSGCGDPGHPTTSARVVSTAAAKTTKASTARLSEKVTGSVNGRSLGEGRGTGIVDSAHRNASISFDLTFLAKATGESEGTLKGRLVLDGDNVFVNMPAVAAKLPLGRRWVESTRSQVTGGASAGLSGLGTVDPTRPVDHLRAVVGKTEVLGRENVNGTSTSHYRTAIDYRLYLPLIPRSSRAGFAKHVTQIENAFGAKRFPVEVWIARDGTIRRSKTILEGRGLKLEDTLELTAVGRPLRIHPPPQALVLDARKP